MRVAANAPITQTPANIRKTEASKELQEQVRKKWKDLF